MIAQRFRRPRSKGSVQGFPLRGLAQCATCHGRMTAERHGRFGYYRCCRQQYQRTLCTARYCNAERVHGDLDRICREITQQGLPGSRHLTLSNDDSRKAALLRAVFSSVTLDRQGVIAYERRRFGELVVRRDDCWLTRYSNGGGFASGCRQRPHCRSAAGSLTGS